MSGDASAAGQDRDSASDPLKATAAGRTGLSELDPAIHAQPRLRIVVALSSLGAGGRITFPRLQDLVGMTSGNLATHLRKLEDAGYVASTKAFRLRIPVTWLSLTESGRRAFQDYTAALAALLSVHDSPPSSSEAAHTPRSTDRRPKQQFTGRQEGNT
jgi:DNA-binding MarR family transcriptional regulator